MSEQGVHAAITNVQPMIGQSLPRRRIVIVLAAVLGGSTIVLFSWAVVALFANAGPVGRFELVLIGFGAILFASTSLLAVLLQLIDSRRHARRAEADKSSSENRHRTIKRELEVLAERIRELALVVDDRTASQAEAVTASSAVLLDDLAVTQEAVVSITESMNALSSGLKGNLDSAIDRLGSSMEEELDAYTGRWYPLIDGLIAMYSSLEPPGPMTPMRGWAISPDLGAYLVATILKHAPTLVVETGSGVSSALIGLALRRLGGGNLVSLEHDVAYAAATRDLLELQGVTDHVDIYVTDLKPHHIDGSEYMWYDIDSLLLPSPISILFVDGPPGTMGKQPRYPALPLLRSHLQEDALIIVDDMHRADERAMIESWSQDDRLTTSYLSHEKGTAVLRLKNDS